MEDKNFETNKNFKISYNILSKTKKSNSKNDSDIPDEKYNSNNDEISNQSLINTNKISKNSNYKTLLYAFLLYWIESFCSIHGRF